MPDQNELDGLADLCGKILAAGRHEPDGAQLDRDVWHALEQSGFADLTLPESDGGSGASWYEAAVVLHAVGLQAAAVPFGDHDILASWLITAAGVGHRQRLIRSAGLAIGGAATAVPWARDVDELVLLRDDSQRSGSWQVAILPREAVRIDPGMNLAGEPRDGVEFDENTATWHPVDDSVADEYRLRGALVRTLMIGGATHRVLELVVQHVSTRVQFGRPLSKFQAIQQLVADIAAESALVQSSGHAAVQAVENHGWRDVSSQVAVAAAMSCTGHASAAVVRRAHQALGAMGYTREHPLHRFTNRILAWRSDFGSVQSWDLRVLGAMTAAGRGATWSSLIDQPAPRTSQ